MKGLQASSPATADSKNSASAAIRQGVEWAASIATKTTKPTLTPRSQIHQHRPADVFAANRDPGPIFSVQPDFKTHDAITNLGPPLISIGPNTDTAIDRFQLGDNLLPKLHVLVRTVSSSRWESVFRSEKWDLTYEQASVLSKALLADFQGMPLNPEIVKVSNNFLWLHIHANWIASVNSLCCPHYRSF